MMGIAIPLPFSEKFSFAFINSPQDYHLQIFSSSTSLIREIPQKNLGTKFTCPERD